MGLEIHRWRGEDCPVVMCDHCDTRITQGSDGNYEWDEDDERPRVYFTHKHCTNSFRVTHPEVTSWGSLTALPVYLARNLQTPWKASKEAAELMSGA